MTGFLAYNKKNSEEPEYWKSAFRFKNNYLLYYIDPRKLGKISLADTPAEYCRDHDIGPDLSSLTDSELFKIVQNGRGSIKSTLMNQSIAEGVGNIYSDEILFQAGIDPRKECSTLSRNRSMVLSQLPARLWIRR